MALPKQHLWTINEFREFVARPENNDRLFELINRGIVEESPGRTSNSGISYDLAFEVKTYCKAHNLPCYISGGDAAYDIQGHVVAPDFAYKTTPLSTEYPDPIMPEWAIEIISPTDKATAIRKKRNIYIEAGILYGELYPELQSIDVYAPGKPKQSIDIDGVLDAGDVIPGFSIPFEELFS
jgi:Uma2 family endonuclease